MAQLLTPPASRQTSEAPGADPGTGLIRSLDTLLERYLELLDKHQKLQGELASKLSSGFISLAHANYTCAPGRRYGPDYYDERMKAVRKVALQPASSYELDHTTEPGELLENGAEAMQIFSIVSASNKPADEQFNSGKQAELSEADEKVAESEILDADKGSGAVKPAGNAQEPSNLSEPVAETDTKPRKKKNNIQASDPIRWYGVLVPPSLRSAQKSFTEAVESSLPELASVIVEMQTAEREIIRLRKELGRV
ncbi:hypothetical protein BJY01DRAFT_50426 [Aspergillus pseudoustus]|uniref:Vacuolar ATPase assembly protein VMA22 n=1 Tax=Aspergillus pseudoustus TaxID=1810923 RepID=A0ABR4KRS1_9EURO